MAKYSESRSAPPTVFTPKKSVAARYEIPAKASLALVLAGVRAEAQAFAHSLPESFALFRCRVPAALFHATAETGATVITVPSQSAEQDAAQQQKSQGLPEIDLAEAEERRQ